VGSISPSNPFSAAIRDMNGDRRLDIVSANFSDGSPEDTVSVLLNNGDNTFDKGDFSVEEGGGPFSVALFDIDNDMAIDIITANSITGTVSVLIGNKDDLGNFSSPETFPVMGTTPQSMVINDLNGDGHADIITANKGSNNVSVLLGDGNGNFEAPVRFPVGLAPRSVAIADLNRDGKPDIITANSMSTSTSKNISVLLNQ